MEGRDASWDIDETLWDKSKSSKYRKYKGLKPFTISIILLRTSIKQPLTIGIDLVAMCVNDIITCGAKPLYFLDYISLNTINPVVDDIMTGIIKGCELAGVELIGGETAEMPGTYEKDKFDVAGFAVGVVDEKKILNRGKIKKGDLIIYESTV